MESDGTLYDAGILIGALLGGDARHPEARPLVEAARRGELQAWVTVGILSEVYAALTWALAEPPHSPEEAARAVRLLIQAPSALRLLPEEPPSVAYRMLDLAQRYGLTARRVHDARHAAAALEGGIRAVYTYDGDDWQALEPEGLVISGPPSSLARLGRAP